jgi:hypothetical protein
VNHEQISDDRCKLGGIQHFGGIIWRNGGIEQGNYADNTQTIRCHHIGGNSAYRIQGVLSS